MSALTKIEAYYSHIEWRERWGNIDDSNSFARRYYAHKLWLQDKNQEGAARFVCEEGEKLPKDLIGVDLRYADLEGANLRYSDLSRANLTDANLTGATMDLDSLKKQTKLWNNAKLRNVLLFVNNYDLSIEESRIRIKELAKEHGIKARGLTNPMLAPIAMIVMMQAATIAVSFNNSSGLDDEALTQSAEKTNLKELMCTDEKALKIKTVRDFCKSLSP